MTGMKPNEQTFAVFWRARAVLATKNIRSCFSARLLYGKLFKGRNILAARCGKTAHDFYAPSKMGSLDFPGFNNVESAGHYSPAPQMVPGNNGVRSRHHEPGRSKMTVPARVA